MITATAMQRIRTDRATMMQALQAWQNAHAALSDSIAAALPYGYSPVDVEQIAQVLWWSTEGVENARTDSLCRAAGHPEECPECSPLVQGGVIPLG
ncbi:hypothetical protein ACFW2T_25560 [Streptomyces sp. NPDC058892]|uniref:hypothetical protein n=1 Tax=unclassified Streptomyces TaxID=2593676 RepID=UPI003682DDD4